MEIKSRTLLVLTLQTSFSFTILWFIYILFFYYYWILDTCALPRQQSHSAIWFFWFAHCNQLRSHVHFLRHEFIKEKARKRSNSMWHRFFFFFYFDCCGRSIYLSEKNLRFLFTSYIFQLWNSRRREKKSTDGQRNCVISFWRMDQMHGCGHAYGRRS